MKYNLKKSLNRSTADDSDVHVKISDTGVGIAPEDLNHIFAPVLLYLIKQTSIK